MQLHISSGTMGLSSYTSILVYGSSEVFVEASYLRMLRY